MKSSISLGLAVLVLASSGCSFAFGRDRSPITLPTPTMERRSSGTGNRDAADAFGPKKVYGKQDPSVLIARDGTTCSVSKHKYDSTRIGASVWCAWVNPNN